MSTQNRHTRALRRKTPEASYDEASRVHFRSHRGSSGGSDGVGPEGRLRRVAAAMAIMVAIVVLRLAWLQIFTAADLSKGAENNRTNDIVLHARRGTIYDRNGNVLAMSVDCKDIYANPSEIKDASTVAQVIASFLGGSPSDYLGDLQQDTTFVYVRRRVDTDTASKIEKALGEKKLKGIYFVNNTKRVYPYGNVGVQILGFVNADNEGASGLEYYYNDILAGTNGHMIVETGAGGTPIAGGTSNITEAQNGQDIVLSIDIELQKKAEEQLTAAVKDFEAKQGGSIMAMNPRTGEIYAAASYPLPDFESDNGVDYESLNLKLVSSIYEPGSVFKVITTSIGVDNNLFGPNSTFNIPTELQVGDNKVTDDDWRTSAMDMSVREMLRRSSNVGMAFLETQLIGDKRFAEGIDKFGIGHTTGIDFPGEATGIVRSLDQYEGPTGGNMAFGQGLAIPFIQVIRAYTAVANKGTMVTPHFMVSKGGQEVSWPTKDVISSSTASAELDMMTTVVKEGTGVRAGIYGYTVAGKTGTGQQVVEETGSYGENSGFVASFCGIVNPSESDLMVYVGLNDTHQLASQSAAVVFSQFAKDATTRLNIQPINP